MSQTHAVDVVRKGSQVVITRSVNRSVTALIGEITSL